MHNVRGQKRPGIFLDRDGTINEEIGYLHEPERLALIPGAAQAIKKLNDLGWAVVCVSNQAGVARGYYPIEAVDEVHKRLVDLLAAEGAHLDGIYFCPHHPTEGNPPYRIDCRCRKPAPGMLEKAAIDLNLDLSSSYMIGDSLSDIHAAQNAGLKAILVLTGYGKRELGKIRERKQEMPYHICPDLKAAVDWIIDQ